MKLDANSRKSIILTAAIRLANKHQDVSVLSWTSVTEACSVNTNERTARYHFKKIGDLLKEMSGDSRLCDKCRLQITDMGLKA